MPDDKPQLHATDLRMLSDCAVQYEFRRIKGIIAPPGVSAIVGTGTHAGIARNLQHKIDKGEMLDEGACSDVAAQTVVETWAKGVLLDDDEQARGVKSVKDEAIQKAARLSKLHRSQLAPGLEPKAVEAPWVIVLKGWPVDLTGMIDLEEMSGVIRDNKTSARTPKEDTAHNSTQLTTYALAKKVTAGKIPPELYLDYLVDLKTPKIVSLPTTRSEQDIERLFRRIETAVKVIESGIFMPCDPDSWKCSPKWCGYWSQCPYSRHPVSVGT